MREKYSYTTFRGSDAFFPNGWHIYQPALLVRKPWRNNAKNISFRIIFLYFKILSCWASVFWSSSYVGVPPVCKHSACVIITHEANTLHKSSGQMKGGCCVCWIREFDNDLFALTTWKGFCITGPLSRETTLWYCLRFSPVEQRVELSVIEMPWHHCNASAQCRWECLLKLYRCPWRP